jgi:hypothetical protein
MVSLFFPKSKLPRTITLLLRASPYLSREPRRPVKKLLSRFPRPEFPESGVRIKENSAGKVVASGEKSNLLDLVLGNEEREM